MASLFKKIASMAQLKGKCQSCRVPFRETDVPKWVKTADNSWKQVCRLCFKAMGGTPRTNILGDADHVPKKRGNALGVRSQDTGNNPYQGKLW